MEKRYCRNDKGLCSQVFMQPIGLSGYVLLCGNFCDPVKDRLHLLNHTRHGIVRLKECRAKFKEHKQTARNENKNDSHSESVPPCDGCNRVPTVKCLASRLRTGNC